MKSLARTLRRRSEWLKRIDRVAADLNIVLVVFAIGLATLDFTFLVTQKVIDHLPQVTRVTWDTAPASPAPRKVEIK